MSIRFPARMIPHPCEHTKATKVPAELRISQSLLGSSGFSPLQWPWSRTRVVLFFMDHQAYPQRTFSMTCLLPKFASEIPTI